jgi:zona occludens toxin
MAINFVTGLPRAGKTLWTLDTVKRLAEKEKRQVYTCNIPEVTLDGWKEIEHPDLWLTLPVGSIVIIDELQDFWQKMPPGQKVPLPILELSKHGKRGIDFYIITQEPDLVHSTPRSLCQHHFYVVRAFGMHKGMVHKFERMQLHPEKVKKNSEKIPWSYPKQAFGRVDKETGVVIVKPWYKSAEVHTVKRQIPKKVFAIPLLLVFTGLVLWGGLHAFNNVIQKASKGGSSAAKLSAGAIPSPAAPADPRPVMTADEYVASFNPRINGFEHTSPRYDQVTQPTQAPYPAACVKMGDKCRCYTQQATVLPTPEDICVQIVKNGYFMDWQQSGTTQSRQQSAPTS